MGMVFLGEPIMYFIFGYNIDHIAKCHMVINNNHLAMAKNQVAIAKNQKVFKIV
jgi:hypothetical protein